MIRSGIFNVTGAALRMAISIVSIPLLIRMIGVEEYGIWTLVSTVVAIATLAEAGLSVSTTVFLSKDLANGNQTDLAKTITVSFSTVILLGLVVVFSLSASANYLMSTFTDLSGSQLNTAVAASRLGGIVVFTRLIQRICAGIAQAYQAYGLLNIISTAQSLLTNFGILVVAHYDNSVLRLMQWHLVSSIFLLCLYLVLSTYLLPSQRKLFIWCNQKFYSMFTYGGLTWISSIGSALFNRFDKLLVSLFLGTESLGIYAAFTDIASQINTFSSIAIQPMLPEFSRQIEKRSTEAIQKLQSKAVKTLYIHSLVTAALGGALITFAPYVLGLVLPDIESEDFLIQFQVISIIYTIYSLNAVGYYMMLAFKKASVCTAIVLTSGIVSLLLITAGAYSFGLSGAILGNFGYIITLLATDLGMNYISVSKGKWLKFLIPFSLWFSLVIVMNFYLLFGLTTPQSNIQRAFVFLIQNVSIIGLIFLFLRNSSNFRFKSLRS
ncbi:MAG: oligosaccharide flippase family protein [Cyanobacteria bacterium P01_H01_bin.21]